MNWLKWDLNLKIRLTGDTVFNLLFWMYFPFITLFFSEAFGKSVASVLMAVPPIFSLAGGLFGGFLSDRLGRRPAMLLGAFMQASMFAVFALSSSHWLDYFAYIGIGLGGAIYNPASSAMVADVTPPKDRRMVYATFVTGRNIGAVFGPALGSVFFFQYRHELLWTCTAVTLMYSLAILLMIKETLPAAAVAARQGMRLSGILKEQVSSYGVIFRDRLFALYIAAGILVTIAFMQLDMYLAVYVTEYVPAQELLATRDWSFSLSSSQAFGLILGLNGLLFVLGVMPVTKWFEEWPERNVLILSSLLFGAGMFLFGFTTQIWLLLIFTVIFTVGEISRSPVTESFISKYAPDHARGQYMGASGLQFSVGRLFAPVTVLLSTWFPPLVVFGFIFLVTILSSLLYIRVFKMLPASYYDPQREADAV
ncbi:multidrug resistance protein [Paenibacillus chitinolyticus]|uniref:MDR family MFS transporter n=1 Tax=Paenibacillus chitinolyticus TaxID=79263 RepID=UPI0026E4AED4|nr:MFS transporter [Paenibacillus chitinolyticus]GKS12701.1 multidrug resistance protein [Paenibacillus chitinolyticus]